MEAADREIAGIIDRHGWAVLKVGEGEDEPGFAYSIGLFQSFGHPEVIVFGLPPDVMHEVINGIGEQVRRGHRFSAGEHSPDVLEGYECAFGAVAPGALGAYLGAGLRFYGREFPALHCIWPDREGRFPWEPGTAPGFRSLQPMLSDGPEPHTHVRPTG